jgi:hypothetical protein
MKRLLLLAFCALLLVVPTIAQNKKALKAVFKVVSVGDGTAIIEPLLPVQFTLQWEKGTAPLTDTFINCEILAKAVAIDDKKHIIVTTTALRCKGKEFALSGVQFTPSE